MKNFVIAAFAALALLLICAGEQSGFAQSREGTWSRAAPMTAPRSELQAITLNGKIYVIGGRLASAFASAGSNSDVVEVFDPAANTWGAADLRMPTARR